MNHLIFYKKKKPRDVLTKERVESRFGKLKMFEAVGMVLSPDCLDIKGISMHYVDSSAGRMRKLSEIPKLRGLVIYYFET